MFNINYLKAEPTTYVLQHRDSITYGEYDGILGGWVDLLKRDFHLKFYND